jgi:hypothetical protein
MAALSCAVLLSWVGVAGSLPSGRGAVAAGPLLTFDSAASADAFRVGVTVAGAPLTPNLVDVGGPTSQALVNGLGKSQAFASFPYPGDAALTLPGTLAPVIGLPAPPGYPLIATSDASTAPKTSRSYPGITLTAASQESSSTASAVVGPASGPFSIASAASKSTSNADSGAGNVQATSESSVDVVSVAGVLTLGHVHASATARRAAAGERPPTSSFEADGVRIAGVAVGVTDAGILLPGAKAPVPDTAGLSPVLDAAGISMKLLPAERRPTSIVSSGLVVSLTQAGPTGDATVSYTFGRAAAAASGTATESTLAGALAPAGGLNDVAPSSAAGAAAASAQTNPAPAGAGVLAAQPSPVSAAPPAPASLTAPASRAALPAGSAAAHDSAGSIYLLIVLGAIAAAGGVFLIRVLGERLT